MASDLTPFSIVAPGFYGINTQDSPISLSPEYALEATNCVIDSYGRVAARKGWTSISNTLSGTPDIGMIHSFITEDGAEKIVVAAGNSIYSLDSGILTTIYSNIAIVGSKWKAVNFNDKCYLFQRNHDPLVISVADSWPASLYCEKISLFDVSVQKSNEVLSAYGRLWNIDTQDDKITLQWSDTLIGEDYTGGGAGTLDLDTVFTNGNRPAVALAAFNKFLVIFCDKTILIFQGAEEDPNTSIALYDIIDNTGCISRDSVVDIGTDIFFLADTGVRSLGRIVSEKSAPIFDVSRNVRDALIADIKANNDNEAIVATYSESDGYYLLTLKKLKKTYCFDLKNRLENNVCRVTTWTLAPNCYANTLDRKLLMGFSGVVGVHEGYNDNDFSIYELKYTTSHLSGNQESLNSYKFLKQLRLTLFGAYGYKLNIDYGYDYKGVEYNTYKTVSLLNTPSEYGTAEFGIAKYGQGLTMTNLSTQLLGDGRVFQFTFRAWIDGYPMSIQQIDFFSKLGRLHNNV